MRILDDEFDKSGNGNRFFGAYATATDARAARRRSSRTSSGARDRQPRAASRRRSATCSQTTIGVRWAGKLPARLDYSIEMAVADAARSAPTRQRVGRPLAAARVACRAARRAASAANSTSRPATPIPTDGTRGTFDQLYPTPHDKYGLADQVGWRNIHHVRAGSSSRRSKDAPITANYHSWWLAETRDGLYSASGALLARVAGGRRDRRTSARSSTCRSRAPLTPQLQLAGGYAHIFPGAFLKQATPGASYSYPYVMVTYVFLGGEVD